MRGVVNLRRASAGCGWTPLIRALRLATRGARALRVTGDRGVSVGNTGAACFPAQPGAGLSLNTAAS